MGSGNARTFLDLVKSVFTAIEKEENIHFIDTPADIRDKYQYFTEANMRKLRGIGYESTFLDIEDGIRDYISYLSGVA